MSDAEKQSIDLKSMLQTDKTSERGGREIEFAPGVAFTIARANTPAYTKALRAAYGPYELLLRGGELDPEIDAKLNAKVIAESILKGWSGVVYGGKELEYNFENAVKILLDLPDLREWVWQQAQNASHFRTARMAETGKGSGG